MRLSFLIFEDLIHIPDYIMFFPFSQAAKQALSQTGSGCFSQPSDL
jgi:hypothetical protein